MSREKSKYDLDELQKVRKQWKEVPMEVVPEKFQKAYEARKKAMDMYIDNVDLKTIENITGVKKMVIMRLLKKCFEIDTNGCYRGYTAVIPYSRSICNKQDSLKKGYGTFSTLLNRFPELHDFLMGNYYGDKKYTLEKNMNLRTLHKKFLEKCKELGVQEYEYPFNTSAYGYVSLIRYVRETAAKDLARSAVRLSKDNMQKVMSTGYGTKYSSDPLAPYQRVQVDGHIIDLGYNVQVEHDDGTVSRVMATRPWLFAVIDVSTRCIVGFSVSQEFNYNQFDVLRAVRDAVMPRKRIKFTIEGFAYPENGGYPSMAFPNLKYPVFDEIMLDNAKSHLAQNTVNKVVDFLGCSMNFGSVATPETRGIIERFFGTLETKGFHKLPATTGSNSNDLKRNRPEKECVKYDITYDEIIELLEILIAEYNNSPHNSLLGETPLQAMKRKLDHTCLIPASLDEEKRADVEKLLWFTVQRTVRGGSSKGKRAYVQYENAIYRNNLLSSGDSYVGQKITLLVDPEDVSSVEAYAADGTYLGELDALGEYGKKSHSLKSRRSMAKLARGNNRNNMKFSTPVSDYEEHLRNKAVSSRRDATKADILRREMGKPTIEERREQDHEVIDFNEKRECITTCDSGKPVSIPDFIKSYMKEHNGAMPGPEDFLELSKRQKTV